jgi:hypothetical protein
MWSLYVLFPETADGWKKFLEGFTRTAGSASEPPTRGFVKEVFPKEKERSQTRSKAKTVEYRQTRG